MGTRRYFALWDLAQIVMDEIGLRLEMAKRREAEAKEEREREFNDELKEPLVAVQSILDSSAALAKSLVEFREAVKARLDRVQMRS